MERSVKPSGKLKLAIPILALVLTGACVHGESTTESGRDLSIGRTEVWTIPLDPALLLQSATYTPSGKVLVSYARDDAASEREVTLGVMNDDGSKLRTIFSKHVPDRSGDNGLRYMIFPDNKRIFLGDFVIECTPSIDNCDTSELLPVEYPAEVADGGHVAARWSEIIVAPDNRHVAWTTLLSNYAAAPVFIGELRRRDGGYVISDPRIISTIDVLEPDPEHGDGVIPQVLRGGEVKQFVHGGTAISFAGAKSRDVPDSVLQDLPSGRIEQITDTPGYTETTIFSPDERLGITMTTRFSPSTDLAILGLVPRPHPTSLNMGLSMFAYTYGVTGVRRSRAGNVGPALIDIAASKRGGGYQGINLNTDDAWVFHSPMSWHPSSKKALWIEGLRGSDRKRIRIVNLPDYSPAPAVAARPTPDAMRYASSDLSIVPSLLKKAQDIEAKVYGRVSGYIEYKRTMTSIEKVYVGYSDDGRNTYSGRETMQINPGGRSTYAADITLSGAVPGRMDLAITFGPLRGDPAAEIIFDIDASGRAVSRGYAEFGGKRLHVRDLEP
ncbi:MAG: hypothetical protein KDE55_22630 [Novosphingobium sp.]|nr:hypothetical protein [Novosphingobium sp.]